MMRLVSENVLSGPKRSVRVASLTTPTVSTLDQFVDDAPGFVPANVRFRAKPCFAEAPVFWETEYERECTPGFQSKPFVAQHCVAELRKRLVAGGYAPNRA